ncbi:hypothetical protein BYT27DRAFT_7125029 [Phlegmacium glaucopus]|nr:hypothetical protein BYT27DRAFT_7125029 [Phlegmacium glaucopus]
MILACHFQFWGHRLDTALTTLPTYPSNEEDLSGDVLPGSPFLGVLQTPFLVRAEYIRVLNQVKAVCGDSCHKYLAEVTGQPGIAGKTLWIYYALRYCLGEKQPVIWYRAGEFYFFSGGVEIFDSVHGWSPPFTWCFVDASAANRLPDKIYDPVNQLFPIYVTSPKEERWSKIQLRDPKLVVMNPWTKAELEKAATLYLGCKLEDISERLDNAGPSARLCLRYSQAQILDFYANRDASINFDTSRYMVTAFFNQDQQLRIGDVSHRLCVVRRSDSGSVPFILEPISAFIRHRLLTQLWYWEEQDRADMVKQFSRVPGTGGMIGLLFESHYQHEFAKKIDIFVTPMFRTADSRSRWHATFGDFSAAPMLYKACQEALSSTVHRPFSLSISPSVVRTYDRKSEVVIEENIYYVPLADNEVAIDSFIITAGHLYLFQFASGPEHSVKRGLLATLNRFSCLPPVANQHFIFVVPKHLAKFACPHSDDGFLRDHIPYVAQVTD